MVQPVYVGRLLEMGGDSLLMRLCGNLLEVGLQASGHRKCGQIAPAGLYGWLPDYFSNLSALSTQWMSQLLFSMPSYMNGLLALFCLLTFFWCGEYGFSTVGVGVTLRKGCGIQGRNFLSLFQESEMTTGCRCRNWTQCVIMSWIDHFLLSHWYSGVVVDKASWWCSVWGMLSRVGVQVQAFQLRYCKHSTDN